MSNLGLYQWLTTTAKKFGGPVNFVLAIGGTGYVVLRSLEAGVKVGAKQIEKKIAESSKSNNKKKDIPIQTVLAYGADDNGLVFNVGDKFRVLETVDGGVLIEKIGDSNNPYVISHDLLQTILQM